MKMKRMFFLIVAAFSVLVLSCKNDLVSEATTKTASGIVSREIYAPKNLTASKGEKQKISLSWDADTSSKISNYNIYASATPFDVFVKIGETTDSTFSYTIQPGLTRYFYITAENLQGHESTATETVIGASLATPTISQILVTDESTTVHWYMENAEYYDTAIRYEISCYDGTSILAQKQVSPADKINPDDKDELTTTFCVFTSADGLIQNTEYLFEVTAYLISEPTETEVSDRIDARTAALQTPGAAINLVATQGTSKDSIELSFTLPECAYVRGKDESGNTIYNPYPLYFKVSRRLYVEGNTEKWKAKDVIVEHLYFDGTTTGHGLDVTNIDNKDDIENYFNGYVPGDKKVFTDTNIKVGKKYEYMLQSYIDNLYESNGKTPKIVTGNTISVTKGTIGWACAELTLTVDEDPTYLPSADEKNSAEIGFKVGWENFEKEADYCYILKTMATLITSPETQIITYKKFDTKEELNTYKASFDLLGGEKNNVNGVEVDDDEGYYKFVVYIVSKSLAFETSAVENSIFLKSKESSSKTITREKDPNFPNFSVIDGYLDKVRIEWEIESDSYDYAVLRDDIEIDISTLLEGKNVGDLIVFEDSGIENNKEYEYILVAKAKATGIMHRKTRTLQTLGIPVVTFDNEDSPKNKSILISWDKVLKADEYIVTLFDEDGVQLGTPYSAGTECTYEIKEPVGFNNATKAGKKWSVSVAAKNATSGAEAVAAEKTPVWLLGPAETAPTASVNDVDDDNKQIDAITVTWKVVEGAKKYAVKRSHYSLSDTSFLAPLSKDVYYIYQEEDEEGNLGKWMVELDATIKPEDFTKAYGPNKSLKDIVLISYNEGEGIFTLKDKFDSCQKANLEESDSNKWIFNQDKIEWGYPYRYTIIPLDDKDANVNSLEYSNEITKTGSCVGYAHDVTATKAENTTAITLSWKAPYGIAENINNKVNEILPKIFYRSKSTGDDWRFIGAKESGADESYKIEIDYEKNKVSATFVPSGTQTTSGSGVINYALESYEFLVTYRSIDAPNKNFYDDELNNKKDDKSPTENLNKGYLFTLNDAVMFTAAHAGGYKESVQWGNIYDYDKKAVGPESIEIQVLNKNFSKTNKTNGDWQTVLSLDPKDYTVIANSGNDLKYEKISDNEAHLSPASIVNNNATNTDGLLKVLRDAKHYYRIIAKRGEAELVVDEEIVIQNDKSVTKKVFAYREITDEELAKAAMLTFTYGFYIHDGGKEDLTNVGNLRKYIAVNNDERDIAGVKGKAHFSDSYRKYGVGKYGGWCKYEAYDPKMLTPYGTSEQFLKITSIKENNDINFLISGDNDRYIKEFMDADKNKYPNYYQLTVEYVDSKFPGKSKTVAFRLDGYNKIGIKVDGNDLQAYKDDYDTRRKWFPIMLLNKSNAVGTPTEYDNGYYFCNKDYGWWD